MEIEKAKKMEIERSLILLRIEFAESDDELKEAKAALRAHDQQAVAVFGIDPAKLAEDCRRLEESWRNSEHE